MLNNISDLTQTYYSPLSPEHQGNPYEFYATARQQYPVFYSPMLKLWIVTRYAEIAQVLKDTKRFSSANSNLVDLEISPEVEAILKEGYPNMPRPSLVDNDPPGHTRVRSLVSSVLTPARIAALEPHIYATANALLDDWIDSGRVDIIRGFASPLPLLVIGDFLGVTFYEILSGQLPFTNLDPLEVIYCHLARQPKPIQELNPKVPVPIAAIVTKLMAKNAEDRYQTAVGLLSDLEFCLDNIQNLGQNLGNITQFIPGKKDRAAQLLIPQKLYGREQEISTLLAAFDRTSQGNSDTEGYARKAEIILVSGYSGIGKSSLVAEVHKPIVQRKGYFISGKFDQLGRNIPYASLIQAFQSLMRQLLTESADKLQNWQEKLLAALGANGQVIIDVIPEVELIIGKQPEVPQLGATESQKRFHTVFQKFIQVFTQPEHALVLFLDDLQWADTASLNLIQVLMTNLDSKYLLLIGAYRDNEVSPAHRLINTLSEIEQAGTVINNIVLRPLSLPHVQKIVADTLSNTERTDNLAELLFYKTQGNPFFVTQLLNTLYQEKLLNFDFEKEQWVWDIQDILSKGIADKSIVELIASNIQKLPEKTQMV